jgi:acyl dehydratase
MAINRDYIGREYRASATYEVGREHVRRFAEAIRDSNPVYTDPQAARALGHPDCIAPPTFLTVLNFRFALEGPIVDPGFGLDYSRVVHGEQRFELHRPVRVGDVLQMVSRIEDIKDAGRNELIAMAMQITDAAGERVATVRSTIVSRGTAAAKEA